MEVSKAFSRLHRQFAEEIESLRDPKNPQKLANYTGQLLKNLVKIIPMIEEEPVYAAQAFFGQLKFTDRAVLDKLVAGKKPVPTWSKVRKSIQAKPEGREGIHLLEDQGKHEGLLLAVGLNYLLANQSKFSFNHDEEAGGDIFTDLTDQENLTLEMEDA